MSTKDVFKVTSSALPDGARVAGFRGTESISKPYEFDVFILLGAEGNDLDLADVVGAKMKLEIDRADGRPAFAFNGILSAFELLHEIGDRSLFHATLVPQLWQLSQTFHSYIWTGKSIPDILKEVLEDSGFAAADYSLRLTATYKPQEHVCQYQESNLDFISRWMEREGMYYYFEQGDEGEVLVITDSAAKHDALDPKPVRFFSLGGHDGSAGEALHTFTCKQHALPATIKLADYDYGKPTLDVSGVAPVTKTGLGEISVYGHRFFTPDDGKRLAKVRAEELLARQAVYRGAGTEFHLRSGYFFTLENHPRAAFDQKYLATEVVHAGNQAIASADMRALTGIVLDRVYWVEVTAIPAATQFRAVRTTAWPRIYGFENGIVGGAGQSDYAQIDDQGRYNVKFKFDESPLDKDQASTWVRMLQPHGGNPEGFHFPLRNGTEVLFTFLGGDPDRPVITGVAPNAHNPSPVTKGNNTRNIIQTGGLNKLEIEDKKGGEWAELYSPNVSSYVFLGAIGQRDHNFVLNTEGTGLIHTTGNHDRFIDAQMHEVVKASVKQEFNTTVTQIFGEHHDITVESGGRKEEVKGGYTQEISGGVGYDQSIAPKWHTKVEGPWNMEAEEVTWKIDKDVTVTCNKWEVTQKGEVSWHNLGAITEMHMENKLETTMGTATEMHIGLKTEVLIGGKIELTVGASAELTIAGATETFIGLKKETMVGGKAELTVGAAAEITIAATYEAKVGPHSELKTAEIRAAEEKAEKAEAELKKCTAYVEMMSTMVTRAGTSVIIQAPNVTFL